MYGADWLPANNGRMPDPKWLRSLTTSLNPASLLPPARSWHGELLDSAFLHPLPQLVPKGTIARFYVERGLDVSTIPTTFEEL